MDDRKYNELKSLLLEVKQMLTELLKQNQKQLLTPKEVCALLHISRSTYQRYVDSGIIEQIRIGGNNSRAYVERCHIERLVEEGKI